jgi:hypothetical protein
MVLSKLHASSTTEHSRINKTYERFKRFFFRDCVKQDVLTFMVECDVCQHNEGETIKALGTLQLILIPPTIWRNISMDFIMGLPKSINKSIIMAVVNRLSKYAHFFLFNTHSQHP